MKTPVRFVQLVPVWSTGSYQLVFTTLYALDDAGQVWCLGVGPAPECKATWLPIENPTVEREPPT